MILSVYAATLVEGTNVTSGPKCNNTFEDPNENHRCVTGVSSQNILFIIITVENVTIINSDQN